MVTRGSHPRRAGGWRCAHSRTVWPHGHVMLHQVLRSITLLRLYNPILLWPAAGLTPRQVRTGGEERRTRYRDGVSDLHQWRIARKDTDCVYVCVVVLKTRNPFKPSGALHNESPRLHHVFNV